MEVDLAAAPGYERLYVALYPYRITWVKQYRTSVAKLLSTVHVSSASHASVYFLLFFLLTSAIGRGLFFVEIYFR